MTEYTCYVCGKVLKASQAVMVKAGPHQLDEPHCKSCA